MIRQMLRRAMLVCAATLVVAVPAGCGDHGGHSPSGNGGAPTGTPASGAVFNDADVTFAQMMIIHHRQAVEMSALADGRAADREVIDLAKKIQAAQDPEIAVMTGWLTQWAQPTLAADGGGHGSGHADMPGMMSAADMAKLKAASAADFDRRFCTMMIAHHEGAVTMARDQLAKGANPQAKALSQQIAATQQAEIDAMRAILGRL